MAFDLALVLLLAFFLPHAGWRDHRQQGTGQTRCLPTRGSAARAGSASASRKEAPSPPKKTRQVSPDFPELPSGTTVGGLWVGEALIDQQGKVANVWTIRPLIVRPAFPPLNEAIVDAIQQWEFDPLLVEKVPVPVCMTLTVHINLR